VYGSVGGTPEPPTWRSTRTPTLSQIFAIERELQAVGDPKCGLGNTSVAEGREQEHTTHQLGIEMDIRLVRKDKMPGHASRRSRLTRSMTGRPGFNCCLSSWGIPW
jgi:hypothetical protein